VHESNTQRVQSVCLTEWEEQYFTDVELSLCA